VELECLECVDEQQDERIQGGTDDGGAKVLVESDLVHGKVHLLTIKFWSNLIWSSENFQDRTFEFLINVVFNELCLSEI